MCLIAKNEEANLPACLPSVAGLVDEMIVVDTGSTDRDKGGQRGQFTDVVRCTAVMDHAVLADLLLAKCPARTESR
jgi:hypothetical protein